MSSNVDVKIIVTLQDNGSRNLLQQLGLIDNAADKVNTSAAKAGSAFQAMNQKAAQGGSAMRSTAHGLGEVEKKAKNVTKEIDTWISKTKSWGSMGAQAVAGIAAAKAVVGAAIKPQLDYETQAQHTANTLYHDQDAAGKIAGKQTAEAHVDAAVMASKGGVTHEDGMLVLESLAAGGMARDDAYRVLPELLKAKVGAQMDSGSFADLTNTLSSAGFKGDELVNKISAIVKGGQLGTFEADSMVKNGLSQAILNYKGMGMNKDEATNQAVADFQMAKKATGSDATAATSVLNMQNKIMSSDLQGHFAKEFKMDLRGELKKEVAGGNTIAQGFQNVVDRLISSNKAPANVTEKLKGLRDAQKAGASADEIQARLDAIKSIDTSGMLSDVLTDMQALMGLKASREFKAVGDEVKTAMVDDKGKAVQGNFEANTDTVQAHEQHNKNADFSANQKPMNGGGGDILKAGSDALANLKTEFPTMTAALNVATTAIEALTVAIVASGAVGLLTNKGGGFNPFNKGKPPTVPPVPAQVHNAAGPVVNAAEIAAAKSVQAADSVGFLGKASSAFKSMGWLGTGAKALGVLGTGLSLANMGMMLTDSKATGHDKAVAVGGTVGGIGGGWSGATLGAAIGTAILPGIGTAVGGAIGGIAGAWGGGAVGEIIGGAAGDLALLVEAFNERKSSAQTPAPVAPPAMSTQAANAGYDPSRHPMSMLNPQSINLQSLMLANQPKAPEPTGQSLIQANAQLQQVNAQMAQLTQVSNNAPLEAQMTAVASSVQALNAKPWTMTATIPIYIDGNMVAQRVNTINAVESYRGAR